MKQERFDELAQNGWILSGSFVIVFALIGLWLDNEGFLILSVIMLCYLPALVVAYCIRGIGDSLKRQKRKRRKASRQKKRKSLQCPSCNKVYTREELDISPTTTPVCPDCEKLLVPYQQ